MNIRRVPSPCLLRYLATLTETPISCRPIPHPQWHQHRDLSCTSHRPAQTARSPRAQRMVQDAPKTWVTSNASEKNDRLVDEVTYSPFVEQDFRKLGLRSDGFDPERSAAYLLTRSIMDGMRHHSKPIDQGAFYGLLGPQHVTKDGRTWAEVVRMDKNIKFLRPLADPKITSQALYILGYQFINCQTKFQQELGDYMIKTAIYMHNRDATLAVLHDAYHRKGSSEPIGFAYQVLESLAKEGTDPVAMCLRAEMLMWPKGSNVNATPAQQSQAFGLAKRAFELSEAGPPLSPPPLPGRVPRPVAVVPDIPLTPPWKVLQNMARMDSPTANRTLWEQATIAGSQTFDDPLAWAAMALERPPLIPFGSKDWVQSATKAAMHGSARASFHLGRYYLQQDGWYPTKVSATKRDKTGFEWIELSISQAKVPIEVSNRVLLMALLVRESGDWELSRRWLQMGLQRLNEIAEMRSVNQGRGSYSTTHQKQSLLDWINGWKEEPKEHDQTIRLDSGKIKIIWKPLKAEKHWKGQAEGLGEER